MPSLKHLLNTTSNLIDAVEIHSPTSRGYLGASSIGDSCERKLWYGFHFVAEKKKQTIRQKNIFNTGHIAESFIIEDLKRIGYKVYRKTDGEEMTGHPDEEQDEIVDVMGHFKGHTDGTALGVVEAPKTEHLLEMKTMNDKNFAKLKKLKVRKAQPKHYSQMQVYMRGLGLKRALYVAYNKNTSEYYFERVYFNAEFAEEEIRKAYSIIMSEYPPTKYFDRTWYECKFCDFYDICHNNKDVLNNCRTCDSGTLANNGEWECAMDSRTLSIEEQLKGCCYYSRGWGL